MRWKQSPLWPSFLPLDVDQTVAYDRDMTTIELISMGLRTIRDEGPSICNMTSPVVQESASNALLALGGVPLQIDAADQVADVANVAAAVVVGLGCLTLQVQEGVSRAKAGVAAAVAPLILDISGVAVVASRVAACNKAVAELRPLILIGTAADVIALCSADPADAPELPPLAAKLAREMQATVVVVDGRSFVTDGRRLTVVRNGHRLMRSIAGHGALVGVLTGGMTVALPDSFDAAVAGLAICGIAAEVAASDHPLPGSFKMHLIDALATVDEHDLRRSIRVVEKGGL